MGTTASPPLKCLPRKTLTKGRPGSRVTFFPSQKCGDSIACGNLMQADFCVHLEHDHVVKTYECRPPTLRVGDTDFKADFLLTLEDGSREYRKFLLLDDQLYGRFPELKETLETQLRTHGSVLHWLTPAEIPSPLLTSNLRYLYHYGFSGTQVGAKKVCRHVMGLVEQRATVDALLASGAMPQDISRAIFSGALCINFEQRLTRQTMVYGGHDGHF
jgi:hypothetical protein